MTEVEALLSVDAGHTPPGIVAFFMDDGRQDGRRARAVLAALAALATVGCALAGVGRIPLTLLAIGVGILAVRATPTLQDKVDLVCKRQVMVVTGVGLIVRDASGLRTWRFEDLAEVVAGIFDHRAYLDLIDQHGTHHTIEYFGFRRAERIRRVISQRLRTWPSSAG
jgi:hypothetical protein